MRAAGVPLFKLYGEGLEWSAPDPLHCESIAARSRLHGWRIDAHRHPDLTQLLYVREGSALLDIDGRRTELQQPALQVVPPLCIHGFHFSETVDGQVLTLAAPLVTQLKATLGALGCRLERAELYLAGPDRPHLDHLFAHIGAEYASPAPGREPLLQALVTALAVWIGRQAIRQEPAPQEAPGQAYLARFQALVEAHYREHWSLEAYAGELGITSTHLNNLCRRFAGQNAQAVLHQRLLLEAKRLLIYTALSASQVSDTLGFSEPAYFSRFFKRLSGQTPKAFRQSR